MLGVRAPVCYMLGVPMEPSRAAVFSTDVSVVADLGLWRRPRLVVLDIDGTICATGAYTHPEAHKTISAAVRAAIAAAVGSGASVVLGTGRTAPATIPFLDELGISSGRAICSNGAVVIDVASGQVVQCTTFELAGPARILHDHLPDAVFVAEVPGEGVLTTAPTADSDTHFGMVRLVHFDELARASSTRLAVHWRRVMLTSWLR